MSDQNPSDKILHQDAVEEVIADHLEDSSTQAAIADPASPGASYVQAEVVALRTAIVGMLGVMRDAGLIPT
jgi:hypothetical protein